MTRYHISAAILYSIRQPFQNPWLRSCHPKSRCIVKKQKKMKQYRKQFCGFTCNFTHRLYWRSVPKSSMHWTWFLQSDENPRSSSYTVKMHHQRLSLTQRCPTKPVRRQHVDKAGFQPDHKHNASSIAVPSCNGKMTEKPGFTMRHKVRGVLQDDNSKLEKNSMLHF